MSPTPAASPEHRRRSHPALALCSLLFGACTLLLASADSALAAPVRAQLNITDTPSPPTSTPATNKLSAAADVTFTALEDLTQPVFELNNGLNVTKLTDASGAALNSERLTTNSTVHISLPAPITKGSSTTFHFEYSGTLLNADTSPVEGIKLAAVADPVSILLYPGRWFPMTGLFTDRFTAEMHIHVPAEYTAVGSGTPTKKTLPDGRNEFNFSWTKPGFPGSIVAGKFVPAITASGLSNIHVYVTEKRKTNAVEFAALAGREFEYLTSVFGEPESGRINIVELPDDAVSASWAPQMACIAGNRIADPKGATRLLANTPRSSVVGIGGLTRHAQRRLDHQRHVSLWRADVSRRLRRQDCVSVRRQRRLRRRTTRLRHRPAQHARPH